jgi:GNAT superfamily N-acetyltransferase
MTFEIRRLVTGDDDVLARVAPGVFDGPVQPQWTRLFLTDARHHLLVALEDGRVVGMISALDYVHPDKAPQLWINEVGVAPSHQRRGIARQLLEAMLAHGRALGCTEAWLGTEETNLAARRLYESVGGVADPFVLYEFPLDAANAPAAEPTALLSAIRSWAQSQPDIVAVALVGSYARAAARRDSDVDVLILTPRASEYREQRDWVAAIPWPSDHEPRTPWRDATYGAAWSRHLTLSDAPPVELTFAPPSWAGVDPIDSGTHAVIGTGCRILWDPQQVLSRLLATMRAGDAVRGA